MDKVITVSREFGSGGRELGVKLAEKLDIPFYDKELISMAADDIKIAVQRHPQAGCSRSMCNCGTVCGHDSG